MEHSAAACDPSCPGSDRLGRTGDVFVCSPFTLWPLSATQTGSGCFSCLGTGPGRFLGEEQLPEARSGVFSEVRTRQPHPFHPWLVTHKPHSFLWNLPFLETLRVSPTAEA